jgi:hypothetical protein
MWLSLPTWPVIDITKPSSNMVVAKLIFTILIIQSRNKFVMHAYTLCVYVCVCVHMHLHAHLCVCVQYVHIIIITKASVHFCFSVLC